jgi:flagellar biosynthetic protein FliO
MNSLDLLPSFLTILSALAVVLGIMILSVYCIKRIMKKTGGHLNDGELIKIISTKYLGPKSKIMLIEVSGNLMVISLSNHQISLLTRIKDQEAFAQLRDMQQQEHNAASFSDQLAFCKSRLLSLCSFAEKDNKGNA